MTESESVGRTPVASAGSLQARDVRLDAAHLGELRRTDPEAGVEDLHRRLDEDGYLYLPAFHDPDDVRAVRADVGGRFAAGGLLDSSALPDRLVATEALPQPSVRADIARASAPLTELLYRGRTLALHEAMFGEPVAHLDYTWLRVVPPGPGTKPHGDGVFMNRGSQRLRTTWTPLSDAGFDVGGLIILEGSHHLPEITDDYGRRDVDSYCENKGEAPGAWDGSISHDPAALRERLGGRWLTADFRAGDIIVFGMFTVHGSLDNTSDQVRMSTDSRYQPAADPADERWIGPEPIAHGPDAKKGIIC
ncbi:phytanoyl-CoA dioxygenase family protein [Phytoactinopolyspora halotolerans]|uniref:Phytanoyl-CoA dioxygenase family protein n=1 Tax=Phytoactinopolyspora halotolerans TaxID=1981512 RepID=A0A6L9S8U7_9ACTN|nr:phytanoyl-CoA dioxygenase family protein [Phytoactinopolyspora halotolerans]NEE00390.1 phytanoyl-CoA dioxygenase family protein [Phytoactinopolyspora halotolerans]